MLGFPKTDSNNASPVNGAALIASKRATTAAKLSQIGLRDSSQIKVANVLWLRTGGSPMASAMGKGCVGP